MAAENDSQEKWFTDDITLDAELFRIVRANMDKPKPRILAIIREHFDEVPDELLQASFDRLLARMGS